MSTFRRIGKVVGGYKVIVSCTNTPMEERVFSTSEECYAFADEYLEKNYFGVALTSIHHPEGDGVEPDGVNPDSLETMEIEIPMIDEQDFAKNGIKHLMAENTTHSWAEALCIAIGQLKGKDGKLLRVFLNEDYAEHIDLCIQIAKSLRGETWTSE